MPEGNWLLDNDAKNFFNMLIKFAPDKEKKEILRNLQNPIRSFLIPVKTDQGYFFVIGILTKIKLPVRPAFDKVDLELLQMAHDKAMKRLESQEQENNENVSKNQPEVKDDTQ